MFTFPTTFFWGNLLDWLLTGLVAYYGLDSNANDAHWSNDWTGVSVTRDTSIKIVGTASASFPTTSNKIDFSNFTVNDNFTINLWLRFAWTSVGFVYSSRTSASLNEVVSIYVQSGNVLFTWWGTDSPSQSWFNDSSWHMATLTKDWTTYKYYMDSVYEWTFTNSNVINTLENVWLWYLRFNNSFKYNWRIDEFGVRDTPLTDTQITTLYNGWSWLAYSDFV